MSGAPELLGQGDLEAPRPRPFEVGRVRAAWVRTAPLPAWVLDAPDEWRLALARVGTFLTPWRPREEIVAWGVEATFADGVVERWSWTVRERRPPLWIGEPPPESAGLLVAGSGDERLVVTRLGLAGGGYAP